MPKKAVGKTVSKVEGQLLKICATRDWSRNLKFFSSLTPDEQICIQKVVIHKVMYTELRAEDMVKIVELMKTRTSQEEEGWDTCYGTVLIRRAKTHPCIRRRTRRRFRNDQLRVVLLKQGVG